MPAGGRGPRLLPRVPGSKGEPGAGISPEGEAFLAMWNYCICRAWQVLRLADTTTIVELTEDSYLDYPIVRTLIIDSSLGNDAQALATAIMQVVGK